jgi:hypothetical protein
MSTKKFLVAATVLIIGLAVGHAASAAQSDESVWFKKISKLHSKDGDLDWQSAKTFCICKDSTLTPLVGYFVARVNTTSVRRAMFFCVIPEFDLATNAFVGLSSCNEFEVLPG